MRAREGSGNVVHGGRGAFGPLLVGMITQGCGPEAAPPVVEPSSACSGGTVWVEDLANADRVGHGWSVDIRFRRCDIRPESYQEIPNQPVGCRVNLRYAAEGELAAFDGGIVEISGGPTPLPPCRFAPGVGYRCEGSADGAAAVDGPGSLPNADALPSGGRLRVSLSSLGAAPVVPEVKDVAIGSAFQLDAASLALLVAMPTDGRTVTLGCTGPGGICPDPNDQAFTWVDITTTDADLSGAGPEDMPVGQSEVSVRCMSRDPTGVTIPADALSFLRYLPVTRIRTKVARAGDGWSSDPEGTLTLQVRAGHAVVGYTTVDAPNRGDGGAQN